jgi:SAM-dependent methyltransferase
MDQHDLDTNRRSWDHRARLHLSGSFYDVAGFRAGACTLKQPELDLLGDVSGQDIAHLQCHFGMDSLSLARRGARVTGLDFSSVAVDQARNLAAELALPTRFECANVYDAADVLGPEHDLVFTSYGVLGWLDDMDRWARAVAGCLRPGGALVLAEFHPVVWMFDDTFSRIQWPWSGGPIRETATGSYAAPEAAIELESVGWNHGTADVLGALLRAGFQLEAYTEHRWAGFPCFAGSVEVAPGRYQIEKLGDTIPLVYALRARLVGSGAAHRTKPLLR